LQNARFYLHLVELKLRYLSGGSRSPQRVLSTLSGIETIASLDTPRILAIIVLSTLSGIETRVVKQFLGRGEVSFIST